MQNGYLRAWSRAAPVTIRDWRLVRSVTTDRRLGAGLAFQSATGLEPLDLAIELGLPDGAADVAAQGPYRRTQVGPEGVDQEYDEPDPSDEEEPGIPCPRHVGGGREPARPVRTPFACPSSRTNPYLLFRQPGTLHRGPRVNPGDCLRPWPRPATTRSVGQENSRRTGASMTVSLTRRPELSGGQASRRIVNDAPSGWPTRAAPRLWATGCSSSWAHKWPLLLLSAGSGGSPGARATCGGRSGVAVCARDVDKQLALVDVDAMQR
jgi:hypothetical protein